MNLIITENKVSFYSLNKNTNSTDNYSSKKPQTSQNPLTVLLLFIGHHRNILRGNRTNSQHQLRATEVSGCEERRHGSSIPAAFLSITALCQGSSAPLAPTLSRPAVTATGTSNQPQFTWWLKRMLKSIYHVFITLP